MFPKKTPLFRSITRRFCAKGAEFSPADALCALPSPFVRLRHGSLVLALALCSATCFTAFGDFRFGVDAHIELGIGTHVEKIVAGGEHSAPEEGECQRSATACRRPTTVFAEMVCERLRKLHRFAQKTVDF